MWRLRKCISCEGEGVVMSWRWRAESADSLLRPLVSRGWEDGPLPPAG